MKKITAIIFVLFLSSCEMAQIKYGYYWNPVTVLSIAMEGLEENNVEKFSEVLSESALCNYGNQEGIYNLKQALKNINLKSVNEPAKVQEKYLVEPVWNGYYVYYQEKYLVDVRDTKNELILKINILCQYGHSRNSINLINAPISNYNAISCAIVKIKHLKNNLDEPVCKN